MLSSKTVSVSNIKPLVNIDEKTGLPLDYPSFFAAYRPLVLATAERLHIPLQDREDAAQEVQIKFWLKNGLDMYDPSRKTKFATLLRNWAGMFMLQERDKVKKNARYQYRDPLDWLLEMDISSEEENLEEVVPDFIENDFLSRWLEEATEALRDGEKESLIPLLELCVRCAEIAKAPTRAYIAETLGVPIHKATPLLNELRNTLTDAGLGIESLYTK